MVETSDPDVQRHLKRRAGPEPDWSLREEKCEEHREGCVWWVHENELGCTEKVRLEVAEDMKEDAEIQNILLSMWKPAVSSVKCSGKSSMKRNAFLVLKSANIPGPKHPPTLRKPRFVCVFCDDPYFTTHEFLVRLYMIGCERVLIWMYM